VPTAFELTLGDADLRVRAWSGSDVGVVRRVNEDSVLVAPPLFVVADGMGGHSFGDRASQAAIGVFRELAEQAGGEPVGVEDVIEAVAHANRAVRAVGDGPDGSHVFSGTTVTGIALVRNPVRGGVHWLAFNIGDSRVYQVNRASLTQLSVDHSVVQELLDRGLIDAEQAAVHPERNVITRALGSAGDVDADLWLFPLERRQTFLICSDGLTKELTDPEIARVVTDWRAEPGGDPAGVLVEAAVTAGGRDNVTVVVVDVETSGDTARSGTRQAALDPVLEDTRPRQ